MVLWRNMARPLHPIDEAQQGDDVTGPGLINRGWQPSE
jgi:hypothetical protein